MITRTEAIMNALGWQGGTIHQVAKETGCTVEALLYTPEPANQTLTSDYSSGWFAVRTCDLKWNKELIFPKFHGNIDFWLGAARGMQLKAEGI